MNWGESRDGRHCTRNRDSSHSPLLASPPEDYPRHAEIDAKGRKLLDRNGKPCSYGELLAQADPSIKRPDQSRSSYASGPPAAPRISNDWRRSSRDAKLDTLIIIGDDQNEQFFDDNMPSILIYWGDTIANDPLAMPEDAPQFWRKARSQYHEAGGPRDYPVDAGLATAPHQVAHRTPTSTSATPSA